MVRRSRGRRGDERELVAQLARVLDEADDRPRGGRRAPAIAPISSRSSVGDAVGDSDLVGAPRVAAPAEREQLATEGAGRVLGAEVDRLDAPGTASERWPMTSVVPNALPADGEAGLELRGSAPSNRSRWLAEPNSALSAALAL